MHSAKMFYCIQSVSSPRDQVADINKCSLSKVHVLSSIQKVFSAALESANAE